jgi:hypothetical protein
VIIDNSDFIGVTIKPFENDAPLIVDPNREIPNQVSLQFLQPVRPRHQEVIKAMGGMNGLESALGRPSKTLKAAYKLIAKQCLRPRISKRSDHDITVYRIPVFGNSGGARAVGCGRRQEVVPDDPARPGQAHHAAIKTRASTGVRPAMPLPSVGSSKICCGNRASGCRTLDERVKQGDAERATAGAT